MEYPELDSPNSKGGSKMIWLEMANNDFKEIGISKADMLYV